MSTSSAFAAEQIAEGPGDIRVGFAKDSVGQALYFGEKWHSKLRTSWRKYLEPG